MALTFHKMYLKNFLSFGNALVEINLMGDDITVILGLNHDTGGEDSRNGSGKSAVVDALSYCLFGKTLRSIPNTKLVNKMATRGQGMLAIVEFSTKSGYYRVERGESPSKLKLFRKDTTDDNDILLRDGKRFVYDISRNKNETTDEIIDIIGFDLTLFEYLIANTTESQAFMLMPEAKRRSIIEHLMGLNILTEKANVLKEDRKLVKRKQIEEKSALEATKQANIKLNIQIRELETKMQGWDRLHKRSIDDLQSKISKLESIDIDEQIATLELVDQLKSEKRGLESKNRELNMEVQRARRDVSDANKIINDTNRSLESLTTKKKKLDESICPTCKQHWVADKEYMDNINKDIKTCEGVLDNSSELTIGTQKALDEILARKKVLDDETLELNESLLASPAELGLVFHSIAEASNAHAVLEQSTVLIKQMKIEENPHTDTYDGLKNNAVSKINETKLNNLNIKILHYDYLVDLLQSKDSFLRKSVINRWLPQLNGRINYYLEILELPYVVKLEDDLSMSITSFNDDFSFGNLSKGQRQRVTIAINFAFQDLFEVTNHPISILFVDELLDNGICQRGASQAVKVLKEICAKKGKKIFLITHRQDITEQIDDVMYVELRNRVSTISNGLEW